MILKENVFVILDYIFLFRICSTAKYKEEAKLSIVEGSLNG